MHDRGLNLPAMAISLLAHSSVLLAWQPTERAVPHEKVVRAVLLPPEARQAPPEPALKPAPAPPGSRPPARPKETPELREAPAEAVVATPRMPAQAPLSAAMATPMRPEPGSAAMSDPDAAAMAVPARPAAVGVPNAAARPGLSVPPGMPGDAGHDSAPAESGVPARASASGVSLAGVAHAGTVRVDGLGIRGDADVTAPSRLPAGSQAVARPARLAASAAPARQLPPGPGRDADGPDTAMPPSRPVSMTRVLHAAAPPVLSTAPARGRPDRQAGIDAGPEELMPAAVRIAHAGVPAVAALGRAAPGRPLPATGGEGAVMDAPDYAEGNPEFVYPQLAVRMGLEGTVVLEVEVLPDGRPGRILLKRSSGSDLLDRDAQRQMSQWRFRPALRNGRAQATRTTVPVQYRLDSKGRS